ncbi:MAG: ABC transporter permease [Deltaproteobacteria bacterium]|nr:ABC transporter permease [Deltaproteobacteria bacterium]
MVKFIAGRLALAVLIMLGSAILSFSILTLAPGNAAEAILSAERADDPQLAEVESFMERHGLNNSRLIRLSQWLHMLSKGNFGISLRTGEPVAEEFRARFPATFELAASSMALAIIIALPFGVISAVKQNSILDNVIRFVALWGVSMPNFWLGLLLILCFGVILGWFPTYGSGSIVHLILPTITLGTSMTAILMRLQRASMLEVLNENYIRTARAKGLHEVLVIGKHAFKNTLIPVVTIIGMQFAHLLSGVVIVEQVFAWPGIGHFLVDSINARDYPVIQGFVLIIAFFFVLSNLIVDILYAFLDPRIRYGRTQ